MKTKKITEFIRITVNIALLLITGLFVYGQDKASVEKNINPKIPESKSNEASTNISREEKLVRWAYKKLSIYEIVERFDKAEKKGQPRGKELAQKSLRFELTNFRTGPIKDIQDISYSDLVTDPTGEIIQIGTATSTHRTTDKNGVSTPGETQFYVEAKWVNAKYSSKLDANWTVGDLLLFEAIRFQNVSRYVSYEVTVSLENKTRTYRALALFSNPGQSSQNLKPDFLDSVAGMGGVITHVFNETKLPLKTKRRDAPNQNPQYSLEESNSTRKTFKKQNNQELMNPSCGVNWYPGCNSCLEWYFSPEGIETDCLTWSPWTSSGGGNEEPPEGCRFSMLYSGIKTQFEHDPQATGHTVGNHAARTDFESTCVRDVSCNVHCSVSDTLAQPIEDDSDNRSLWYHVGRTNVANEEHTGGLNQDITCQRTRGYYFMYCFFRDCSFSVSVTIGGVISVNPTGSEVWSTTQTDKRTCRMGR